MAAMRSVHPASQRTRDSADWHFGFERWHSALAIAGLTLATCVGPGASLGSAGGGLLLVGGALIGVPHGASDFLVAHAVLKPRLGLAWLAVFVLGYLTLVSCVLAGWMIAPLTTLILFVVASCLHFGLGDARVGEPVRPSWLLMARATTPVLPILLFHPADVGSIVALLGRISEAEAVNALEALRPLLWPWFGAIGAVAVSCLVQNPGQRATYEAAEIVALATASVLLPPLVTFAIYFCLLHAVRHMGHLAARIHPRHAGRALRLASVILLPIALVCCLALASCWSGLAGSMSTEHVVTKALQMIAALTVPHMALEFVSSRHAPLRLTAPGAATGKGAQPSPGPC